MGRTDTDHTDPKWEEGRDYQLVCGLDNEFNLCERDPFINCSKSNRFLPWRNVSDEVGGDPQNPGDFCLFLDPDTNEWVFEEFMGTWWFEKTRPTCGNVRSYQNGRRNSQLGVPRTERDKRNISTTLSKSVVVTRLSDGVEMTYASSKLACEDLGLSRGNLSMVLNGTRRHTKGFIARQL